MFFEAAADAVVSGDITALAKLLSENPALVTERSLREHRSTLLHYVSANGVEDFRQKTPKNIVEIAKLILDAGADVNAESDAYRGRSTTLGLTATSVHPEKAGVQIALMELLLDRGAMIDGPDGSSAVNACLRNGRGAAAEFLAARGGRLDLEGAAGVGRLDIVKTLFNDDTKRQAKEALAWACEFGRAEVVEFFLDHGIEVGLGLHWAAYGADVEIVQLLLSHHAPLNAKDERFSATPLGWVLYAWSTEPNAPPDRCYQVVSLLIAAGAQLDPYWLTDEKVRRDPKMFEALTGAH